MPLLWRGTSTQETLCCSFCRKGKDEVGQLISNPGDYPRVYICNECVAVCHQISEEKEDPYEGNPLAGEFFDAAEQWIGRESQGHDASHELERLRTLAKLMFPSAG